MQPIDFEAAKSQFETLAAQLLGAGGTGAQTLEALVRWFSETRIKGADPQKDGDMVQMVAGAADMEPLGKRQFVSVDRLVCEQGQDEQTALSFTMVYDQAAGDEPQIEDVFVRLSEDAAVAAFVRQPYVASLLARPPVHCLVTICEI
jgi:hypothetical protein